MTSRVLRQFLGDLHKRIFLMFFLDLSRFFSLNKFLPRQARIIKHFKIGNLLNTLREIHLTMVKRFLA